jgi:endonuclease/exonuclease/phosphatase family metal-dependent hydrolase
MIDQLPGSAKHRHAVEGIRAYNTGVPNQQGTSLMLEYSVAWWNLENLFDVEDSAARPAWLQSALKSELKGWTQAVLETKITQLVRIIACMNQGRGPDLLGVCEVENQPVLNLLVTRLQATLGRAYQVAHHDTSDQRGIDVAFIYDPALFTAERQFFHVILKRAATRDLFQVNFRTSKGRDLIVVGNHWPSRTEGQYESEPYRILAAETLSYWHERILQEKGKLTPILFMGDFNDEPFNRSMTDYFLGSSSLTRARHAESPYAHNLMWPLMGQAIGSHYFQNMPNMLDQFLMGGGFLNARSALQIKAETVDVFREPMMVKPGRYPVPIPFKRPVESGYNPAGFSDHFPLVLRMTETV